MFELSRVLAFGGKDAAVLSASQECKRHVALALRALGVGNLISAMKIK